MADNITLNSGSTGSTLATDDVTDAGGAHYQRIKLSDGTANSTTHVHTGNGVETNALRVTLASDSTGVVKVEGQDAENAAASADPVQVGGRYDATPRTLGDGDAGAIALDADGAVHISDGGNTITVDNGGTFATQVDGAALTALQLIDDPVATLGTTTYTETSTKGTIVGAVRNDTLAALADTDNEIAPLQVSEHGALYSSLAGVQSPTSGGNSRTTPLSSSATFTGTGELNTYPDVMVSCQTDNTGTLYFDFSVDGTNWATFPVNGFAVASGVHEFHTALKGGRYFRVRLVNDAGAQSYLRLYTYYGHFSKIPNAPLNQTIGADSDAIITNSVLAASNGSAYVNIGATSAGNLKISVEEISDGLDIGAGNAGTETQRVSISTDDVNLSAIKTAVELIDNAISGSEMQVDVVAALPAGTNAIGKLAANSGVDIGDVDVTSISAGTNLIGDVGISGARTSGGTTLHYNGGASTLTQIKATGGQLYWISVINLKASVVYLQIFNLASASVTLGTTTPTLQFPVPTQGDTNGAGFMIAVPNGIALGTGISYAITTTAGGATAASSNEAFLNCGYA